MFPFILHIPNVSGNIKEYGNICFLLVIINVRGHLSSLGRLFGEYGNIPNIPQYLEKERFFLQ